MKTVLIILFGFLGFASASEPASSSIEATGQPLFDLAVTNQCTLVLRLPKAVFTRGEPIPFALIFRNIGLCAITLHGHVPLYVAAGPRLPVISISRDGKRFAQTDIDGLATNVLCRREITVGTNAEVVLMQGDLRALKGLVHVRGVDWKVANLGEQLKPGRHVLSAGWETRPARYSMTIKDVEIEIRK